MDVSWEELVQILEVAAKLDCAEVEVQVGDAYLAVRKTPGESQGTAISIGADGSVPPRVGRALPPAASLLPDIVGAGLKPAPALGAAAASQSGSAPSSQESAPDIDGWLQRETSGEVAIVRSPMVGTFYRAQAPGAPPFVEIGDAVRDDSALCLVEVMKLFNTITAGASGVVRAIFVENANLVEYMQPLMAIERTAEPT